MVPLYTELFRIGLDSPVVLIAFMLIAAVVGVVMTPFPEPSDRI